jgi:hypothetical protein
MIPYNCPTQIKLIGAQAGVLYQLCDEDGNLILDENGNKFEVKPDAIPLIDSVLLPTPPILEDITFVIMAIRENKVANQTIHLETYLNTLVSIKVGIDTQLPLVFDPRPGQVSGENTLTVSYADRVRVTVSNTQEGISYEMVTGDGDTLQSVSAAVKGNLVNISLESTDGFNEDTPLRIRAWRTTNSSDSKDAVLLEATLTVLVRPNPRVQVAIDPDILDYGAGAVLSLIAPQTTAEYRLYKRELTPAEYVTLETGNMVIQTGEGRRIVIQTPAEITDWAQTAGFVALDLFRGVNGKLSLETGALLEDTVFIVQATKIENRETLQLTQTSAALVRPNPAPVVDRLAATVDAGAIGVVTVSQTQKGVAYQLRRDTDNELVNLPGYHLTDRGIETERVEVDLVVGEQGEPILLLPSLPLAETAIFNVLAYKILTGVSAELTEKATIDVVIPPGT